MKYFLLYLVVLPAFAEVKFGGFIDTYFALDSNGQENHERQFTTQPSRHNEFNVNLAYIDVNIKNEKSRGRLAVQNGTSVTTNYAAEKGDVRFLQEGYAGIKLDEHTWMDMGIFLGNIGMESWISSHNWTYTRSLFLDYVPYYSSGVRFERQFSDSSMQLQILNGWQNINETNHSKALGFQYKKGHFTYNNFLGDERIVSDKDRFRHYHNFIFQHELNQAWHFLGGMDFGFQSQQTDKGVDAWGATSLVLKNILSDEKSLSYRFEYYVDPHQANVMTGTKNGFNVISSSVNLDRKIDAQTLFRNEIRSFYSRDKIFLSGDEGKGRWDGLFVSSISLTF